MRLLSLHPLLAITSTLCLTAHAASPVDALSKIPACAIECLADMAPAIGCGLVDIECQCTSKNSTQVLTPCFERKCTYDETFAALRAQADLCDRPHDSRSTSLKVNAYMTGLLPVIAVAMRFASRHLGGGSYWWDDWLHLVSVLLVIPMTGALLMCVENGLGRHLWDLTYQQVVAFQKWTYIATIFWAFELLILKYCILCLYLRLFPNVWLKRAVYAFMVFSALFTLPLIGLAVFQCIPVHAIWDLEAKKTAKCIDWITVLRLTVVYEVIAETVLFGLPVPIIMKLQMETSRKIQLMVFFSLGVCVIAVSIARVPFLPGVVNTVDPTYTIFGTSILGFAASGVGHVCAAVPTIKSLLRFCRNGFKHETKQSSGYSKDRSGASSGKRSYKSLQDSNSGSSGKTPQAANKKPDPYRLSTVFGDDNVELRPVSRSPPEPELIRYRPESRPESWDQIIEERPHTISIVVSQPEDDSASNKTILSNKAYR